MVTVIAARSVTVAGAVSVIGAMAVVGAGVVFVVIRTIARTLMRWRSSGALVIVGSLTGSRMLRRHRRFPVRIFSSGGFAAATGTSRSVLSAVVALTALLGLLLFAGSVVALGVGRRRCKHG